MSGYAMAGLAGLQLATSYFAAENIRQSAAINQRVAEINAEFAELDAYDAEIAGFSEVARYQSVIDATLGEQQAGFAAADVDLNFGTAAAIMEETKLIGELNKLELINQAEQQALGFKNQARNFRLGGYLARMGAEGNAAQVQLQGVLGAAGTGVQAIRSNATGYRSEGGQGGGNTGGQSSSVWSRGGGNTRFQTINPLEG